MGRGASPALIQKGYEQMTNANRQVQDSVPRPVPSHLQAVADRGAKAADRAYEPAQRQEPEPPRAEPARTDADDLRIVMTTASEGLFEMQRVAIDLFGNVVQTNLRMTLEWVRLADPVPFVGVQQRCFLDGLGAFAEGSATVVRGARATTDQVLQRLTALQTQVAAE
jgi:hypothetical protein